MKQYRKSDKVMEAENHLKNRACPRNRMSGNNLCRTWMVIVVMMSVVTNAVAQSSYIKNDELPGFYEISLFNNNILKLHEDALSSYSWGKGINFLGVADIPPIPSPDGTIKYNYVIYVDTAYVNRGTGLQKPQYMLAVGTYFANESFDANEAESENDRYVIGRYLFNTTQYANTPEVVNYNKVQPVTPVILDARYRFDPYDRLAFEWAIHKGDSLYILKGIDGISNPYQVWLTLTKEYGEEGKSIDFQNLIEWCTVDTFYDLYFPEGSQTSFDGIDPTPFMHPFRTFKDVATYDDKHSIGLHAIIALDDNTHKDWVFSFRTVDQDMETFVIESETADRSMLQGDMIEPQYGGWISNVSFDLPVIMRTDNFLNCTAFIMQKTDGPSVHNETVADATSNVNVTGEKSSVTIQNAAGKKVVISNMLGKIIVNSTLSSDIATISVPSGIAVVSVEGGISMKVVVQ